MTTAVTRAVRLRDGRWIAGVCTGLAANLRVPVVGVRLAFLVLTLANGIGVIAYLAFWAVLPPQEGRERQSDFGRMLAFAAIVLGLLVLAASSGWPFVRTVAIPLLVLAVGAAIVWQQSESRVRDRLGGAAPASRVWVRVGVGLVLVAAGVVALAVGEVGWEQAARAVLVVLLVLGGVAVVALPWVVRALGDLADERRARIREQERADIATQVHDSVLQTLTLIQRNAGDSQQVRRLARTEERRLRSWLYEPAGDAEQTLAAALQREAARIEGEYETTIDVVDVGDTELSAPVRALLAAATEAMVNAAKHAGPGPISVYCEVADRQVTVFVRDRGPGVDITRLPPDRHGIRDSMLGRMQRAGGTCEFVAKPTGTEVRLTVGR